MSVGSSVKLFKAGDKVLAFTGAGAVGRLDGGAFQNYTVAKELTTAKLPDNLTFEEGSVLPLGIATASAALFDSLAIPLPSSSDQAQGQHQSSALLVWGGSSSVGSNAVQLGHRLGFTVLTTASPSHHEYLRSLGASEVFDYHSPTVVDDLLAAARKAGKPVAYAVDAISETSTLQASADVIHKSLSSSSSTDSTKGGKLAIVLGWPESLPKPDGVEVRSVGARNIFAKSQIAEWVFHELLAEALEKKTYVPSPGVLLVDGGLDGLQTALNTLKKGVSGKKVLVKLE